MNRNDVTEGAHIRPISRRRFVQGLAAGAGIASFDGIGWHAFGEASEHPHGSPATISI